MAAAGSGRRAGMSAPMEVVATGPRQGMFPLMGAGATGLQVEGTFPRTGAAATGPRKGTSPLMGAVAIGHRVEVTFPQMGAAATGVRVIENDAAVVCPSSESETISVYDTVDSFAPAQLTLLGLPSVVYPGCSHTHVFPLPLFL